MALLDWLVVAAYMIVSLGVGLYLGRRGARSMTDFFVSGRQLPWWLAGASMAATTFSVDTPLYVNGLVVARGIAGNWQWWSLALMHMVMVYVFARLWRRAEVVTDAELIEIRYRGRPAAALRATRAFLLAVPVNAIAMGYGMVAMKKVAVALDLVPRLGLPGTYDQLATVVLISLLTLVYAGVAGLWGVVATDFFQLVIALLGAFVVAVYAVSSAGGVHGLKEGIATLGAADRLDYLPSFGNLAAGVGQLTGWTFLVYVGVQWWSFRRSDGGGEFIQRLSACRTEAEAEKAAWFFNLLNYVVRTWPWIIVGLASIAIFPELLAKTSDPELGYLMLMRRFLPAGLLGLVVASLLAAFMSTVSTQINWGASYVANDLYARFVEPAASQERLVFVGRASSVLLTGLAALVAWRADSIRKLFDFVLLIGTGPGAVLILRWFWWRINAWAELTSLLVGFALAIGLDFGLAPGPNTWALKMTLTTSGTAAAWLTAMFLTAPESDETLDAFYRRTRPGGPGWRRQRERTGLAPLQDLGADLVSTALGTVALLTSMFAVGSFVLEFWGLFAAHAATALVAGGLLVGLRRRASAGRAAAGVASPAPDPATIADPPPGVKHTEPPA